MKHEKNEFEQLAETLKFDVPSVDFSEGFADLSELETPLDDALEQIHNYIMYVHE